MYLKKIRLLDWKLYGGGDFHEFKFPPPGKRHRVILVGAKNGFGKTSLLEAIVLGLYGKDGMDIVARSDASGDESKRLSSYNQFISKAWHERAGNEGRTEMVVELTFNDEGSGDEFTVNRTWRFNPEGRMLEEQVELSENGELLKPSKHDEPDDFYRATIAQRTLPSHFARFFLFDGEVVQKLAQRDMAAQVRVGIEGFLGVQLLRKLEDDLRTYADNKRKEAPAADSERLPALESSVDEKTRRLDELRRKQQTLTETERLAAQEVEELQGRLTSLGGDDAKSVKRLSDERSHEEQKKKKYLDELTALLTGDFSLSLVGPQLRAKVRDRIEAEQRLARWDAGVEANKDRAGAFMSALAQASPPLDPPLTDAQEIALRQRVETAWATLWHPPSDGCAPGYRHAGLSDADRARVIDRLLELERLGGDRMTKLIDGVADAERKQTRLEQQINKLSGIEGTLTELTERFKGAVERQAASRAERDVVERELKALDADLKNMRADVERERARFAGAQPVIAKADAGLRMADLIGPFIDEAIGECVGDIGQSMTAAFRAMAHKSLVETIEVDADCQVRLLTKAGKDVRDKDLSAGESELFALSLIAALAKAAEISFPLVVDTPLARLDHHHRTEVLKYFSSDVISEQVIFLSQDTEIVGEYYDTVRTRVAETFLIEHEAVRGSHGRARVTRGEYFPQR